MDSQLNHHPFNHSELETRFADLNLDPLQKQLIESANPRPSNPSLTQPTHVMMDSMTLRAWANEANNLNTRNQKALKRRCVINGVLSENITGRSLKDFHIYGALPNSIQDDIVRFCCCNDHTFQLQIFGDLGPNQVRQAPTLHYELSERRLPTAFHVNHRWGDLAMNCYALGPDIPIPMLKKENFEKIKSMLISATLNNPLGAFSNLESDTCHLSFGLPSNREKRYPSFLLLDPPPNTPDSWDPSARGNFSYQTTPFPFLETVPLFFSKI
jgi:hypothetical protein